MLQVARMEAEVVAMTASFLGGGPGTTVCGSMTSGECVLGAWCLHNWLRTTRSMVVSSMARGSD